jgi:hypothetical protein
MALKDLVVPKWKHSRPEIRLSSIDSISNDLNILREIAKTDTSSQVRIAAIKKIEDELLLTSIINSEKDEQVLDTAKKQLESYLKKIISTSNDIQAVLSALKKYGNEKYTATYLSDHNLQVDVQHTLINMIKSPQLLSKITEQECASEIAEKIVNQITEKEFLERIAKKASNKKIRTLAQEKIDKLFADPLAEEREITRKLQQCCAGMDMQVSPQNYDQAVALLEISRSVWNKYDPQRQHSLSKTYALAEQQLTDKIEQAKNQKSLLETLEQYCQQAERLSKESVDTLEAQFETLQNQWNAVDRTIIQDLLTISLDDRFKKACTKIKSSIQSAKEASEEHRRNLESLEHACSELENFVNSCTVPDTKSLNRLLAHWKSACSKLSPDDQMKSRIAAAEKKYREIVDTEVHMERDAQEKEIECIEHILVEMKSIAQVSPQQAFSRYKRAVQLRHEWSKSWPLARTRKAALHDEFTGAFDSFMSTIRESKEQSSWQQWASEHAKSKILDEIEQLENKIQQGDSITKISRRIGLFESEWRRASRGDREKDEMDERFSAIRDRIFTTALAKKRELLEALQAILNTSEDSDRADEVKTLQKQWNDIGYLSPELENDLSDTFYNLCNTFFEKRKESYQKYSEELAKNSAIREEICSEAEKLATSTDWKATKEAFAQLQTRWDESWPAPHKRSQELWMQFSKNRDLFFENYHTFQSENDKLKEQCCEKAELLLARLSETSPATEVEPQSDDVQPESDNTETTDSINVNYAQVLSEAIKLQKSWKEIGPASMEHSEQLWERFNGTLKKVFSIIDEEHKKNFNLKDALVKEAESIAASDDWDTTSRRFQEIRAEWKAIRPAAYRDEQALWKRLQDAGDTFFGRRRAFFDTRKSMVNEKIEAKEQLLDEMEVLVRISGKSHLLTTTQNQSAAEILKKGIDLRNQLVVEGDSDKTYNNIKKRALEIIDIWESQEQIPGKEFYQLERRFDELLGILKRR